MKGVSTVMTAKKKSNPWLSKPAFASPTVAPAALAAPARQEAQSPFAWNSTYLDFSEQPQLTQLVHQAGCNVVESEGVRSVVATEAIKAGTVLLVEHVINGELEYVLNCAMNDATIFDALYPRSGTVWSKERLMSGELEPLVLEKVDSNGFVCDDGTVSLGRTISAFNHGSAPSASMHRIGLEIEGVPTPHLVYAVAEADIAPNEEIRIAYRPKASAMHPYIEAGDSTASRLPEAELAAAKERARAIIVEYASTDAFVKTVKTQVRVRRAMYIHTHTSI